MFLDRLFRRPPLTLGQQGERLAAKFLRRQHFKILARNAVFGPYEIDIIAQQRDTIAFVEVKTRRSSDFADPEVNVTHQKQKHICRAAERFIAKQNDPSLYYRFDVISVVLPEHGKPNITHFPDAFHNEFHR